MHQFKVWVEIHKANIGKNIKTFKGLIGKKTQLWAVVKSNAYGHGLLTFSKTAHELGVQGFCVDSVVEGLKLRSAGIRAPILVLGPSLPHLAREAADHDIQVTISNREALQELMKLPIIPRFHLKIDTGMHRQGWYVDHVGEAIQIIKKKGLPLSGAYTHFASAKDINYPTFTDLQFHEFKRAIVAFQEAGFKNVIFHASATGGAMINPEYHLDAVRIGIGLYGLWPSRELELQLHKTIELYPVLSWHSVISEVKELRSGDYVGYDLTERIFKPTTMAVVPIGYWHGFDRGLSGIGEVLIHGKRARVLGRVSMDLIVVDVTGLKAKVGDVATLIGGEKNVFLPASEMAAKIGTTHYEIVTRINPLTERVLV
jgi:alanine racemase